jgi:hypothetical protein
MLVRRTLSRPAVTSQTKSLSRSPRFELRRMRNTNGGETASIAIPTARFAAYFVQPGTDLVFSLDPSVGYLANTSYFPQLMQRKVRTYPWVFPVFIERLLTARGQASFDCTIRLQVSLASEDLM